MTETEFVRFVAKSKREIIYFIANNKKIQIWSLKTAIFNLHLLILLGFSSWIVISKTILRQTFFSFLNNFSPGHILEI